jgi:hypothetical protein
MLISELTIYFIMLQWLDTYSKFPGQAPTLGEDGDGDRDGVVSNETVVSTLKSKELACRKEQDG